VLFRPVFLYAFFVGRDTVGHMFSGIYASACIIITLRFFRYFLHVICI